MENTVFLINGNNKNVTAEILEQIKTICRNNFQSLYEVSLRCLHMDLLSVSEDDKRIINNFCEKMIA